MMKSLERSKSDEDIREASFRVKLEKTANSLPITPQKHAGIPVSLEGPLTPTANLKMLVSAAFEMASSRDESKEKRELFVDKNDEEDTFSTSSDSTEDKHDLCEGDSKGGFEKKDMGSGRKLKSLGLLCQKFLSRYPDGSEGTIISLHDVAKELNVERRRIYDIVNVLESLEYVTKQGKNTYNWHGSSRLVPTLSKLKALSKKIYGKKSHDSLDNVGNQSTLPTWLHSGKTVEDQDFEVSIGDNVSSISQDDDKSRRRSKSLGIFCQKLIMLFMAAENPVIALEEAAKEIIEGTEDPSGKTKTKVRRLYDIANILTSMGLIEKTGSRKAAFKWIGVDLNSLQPDSETLGEVSSGSLNYLTTKHSLFSLPCALEPRQLHGSVRRLESRSLSANNIAIQTLNPQKKGKLPRTKSAATIRSRKRSSTDSKENKVEICKFSKTEQGGGSIENNTAEDLVHKYGDSEHTYVVPVIGSPRRTQRSKSVEVSPNERSFREEIKKLQERFPEKLQNPNGLMHLITAHKHLQKQEVEGNTLNNAENSEKGSRCCLLNRLGETGTSEAEAKSTNENSLKSNNSKALSLSSLEVIMDQCQSKKNTATLRSELEKILLSTPSESVNGQGKFVNVKKSLTSESSKRVVQTASIGIQASFCDDVGLSKNDNITMKTKNASISRFLANAPEHNQWNPATIVSGKRPTKETLGVPPGTVSLNDKRVCPSVKPAGPLFLFSLAHSPNAQNRKLVDALTCLKGSNSLQFAQLMPTSAANDIGKQKKSTPDTVEMVPIAPTRIDIRPNADEKENNHSLERIAAQPSFLLKSPSGRAVFPLQSFNVNAQTFSPVMFAKGTGSGSLSEETPMRSDSVDFKAQRVQRQLNQLTSDSK